MKVLLNTFLFISLVLMFACSSTKETLSMQDQTILKSMIDSMYNLDQKHRHSLINIESKYKVDIKSNNGIFLNPKAKKKKLGEKFSSYQKSKDSIRDIIQETNNSNTKLLLSLTEKYGFPSKKRMEIKAASAFFIFVHSPKEYYPKIRDIINSEFKEKRISEYEKAYIFWHIDGRKSMPPRKQKDGSVTYDN